MKNLLFIIYFSILSIQVQAQVGIGTATPDPSASLHVAAADKGMLVPRLTGSQRNNINNPATGLLIYQSDNVPGFYFNAGTPGTPNWVKISTSSESTYTAGSGISITGNVISNNAPHQGTDLGFSATNITGTVSSSTGSNATLPAATTTEAGLMTAADKTKLDGISSGSSTPAGVVLPFSGNTAPAGYLFCYGQAVSRTTYADLFSEIGTTYGTGNGSTTFNLPDLRGRAVFGKDNMGGAAAGRLTTAGDISANNTLGATGGAQTRSLAAANLPAHTHSFSATTASAGAHTHTYQDAYYAESGGGGIGGSSIYGTAASSDNDNNFRFRTSSNGYSNNASNINTGSEGNHTHTVSGATGSTGAGTAFALLNPAFVLNYIIKY